MEKSENFTQCVSNPPLQISFNEIFSQKFIMVAIHEKTPKRSFMPRLLIVSFLQLGLINIVSKYFAFVSVFGFMPGWKGHRVQVTGLFIIWLDVATEMLFGYHKSQFIIRIQIMWYNWGHLWSLILIVSPVGRTCLFKNYLKINYRILVKLIWS